MNVSLTPELERMIAERVASGRYASASEVVRDALRLLEERDRFNQLRQDVRLGLDQLDQGRHRPFDDQTLERIKSEGRKRAARPERKGRAR
ncbi:MAG TPA: type II toxin-antitoxin system ParD family antitoxin [Candidatus Binataceae bacterium]